MRAKIASVAARSALAAAVPAAIVAWFAWRVEPSDAIGMDVLLFVLGSTAGLAGYLVGAHLLGIEEVDRAVRAVSARVRQRSS